MICIIQKLKQYQARRRSNVDLVQKKINAKVRPQNLKYAVGMVMEYRKALLPPHTLCVICDWVPYRLNTDLQPIYNVLLPCGSYKDVAEGLYTDFTTMIIFNAKYLTCFIGRLEPSAYRTSGFDELEDIGLHFSHVFQTHFVPNAMKEREYPEDTAVRHAYHRRLKAQM